ncbi:Serine/threonine-protein phosphatase 7 long form like [Quillaja saponaria]|uniref:Serine/threonine-protein phosphatase 7 long form like n=1 Tax=Quillaja saponaria TaxID=32244 RepID=A0AAD7PBW9_QUISA|nr:Serine/threonine-protein phosphatase 7 long form like [Quillaja saponaria]
MEDLSYIIVEVREEHMITPTGHGDPTLSLAHFLSPSISSNDGQVLEPPHFSYSSSSPPNFAPQLNLSFSIWQYPKKNWEIWVARLVSLHESTWKQAGIYEAILNSTYRINRNALICGISERWCSTTNSFNFPWGGPGSDEGLQTFATCIRVSQIVAFDGIIKQYLPRRVAMQFGMDQDIPGFVIRFDETPNIAWNYYDRAFRNMPLYIPARLFESDVTVRYLKWWKSVLVEKESRKSDVPGQKENEANDNDNNTSNLPKDLKKTGES